MEYRNQNIITAEEKLIIHGCNCQGVMGSGVALAIRNRFPRAYEKYKDQLIFTLGTVQFVECKDKLGTKWIGNCLTQQFYGRNKVQYCSYDAIQKCLEEVVHFCAKNNITAFAMPKIGCGLGGGNWKIVSNIVEEVTADRNILAIIYDNHQEVNPTQ
jgi:O-acetyl-ADP-ribose deacetylase (regulator of RNase III)